MSYLSQLAARTLNQLPSVQPRLPSRFESVRRELPAEAPALLEYATFSPSAPSNQAIVSAPAPIQIAPEPPRVAVADSPTPPAVAPTPYPTQDAAFANTTLVSQVLPDGAAQTDRGAPVPPTPPIERIPLTQVIERDSPTNSTNPTAREQPALIEQHTLIEQRTLIEPERILASVQSAPPEAHSRAPRFAPQVTPYVPPTPEPVPPLEPAPVIQVSIGRIEVRAIHPPTPSAPPTPASKPDLSLDDYLRGVRS